MLLLRDMRPSFSVMYLADIGVTYSISRGNFALTKFTFQAVDRANVVFTQLAERMFDAFSAITVLNPISHIVKLRSPSHVRGVAASDMTVAARMDSHSPMKRRRAMIVSASEAMHILKPSINSDLAISTCAARKRPYDAIFRLKLKNGIMQKGKDVFAFGRLSFCHDYLHRCITRLCYHTPDKLAT